MLGYFYILGYSEKFIFGIEEDLFYIGTIKEVNKLTVELHPFDADGLWFDEVTIPYSKITSVTFGDRYSKT